MIATHTGRLKRINEVIRDCDGSIGIGFLRMIYEEKQGVLELKLHGSNFLFDKGEEGVFQLHKSYFTNITPIKPKMRPWTDEEWNEWFFTDRVVIDRINQEDNTDDVRTAYITVLGMTPEDEDQFYYMGEGEWLSKDHFLESFFDRHGNKFEKEV